MPPLYFKAGRDGKEFGFQRWQEGWWWFVFDIASGSFEYMDFVASADDMFVAMEYYASSGKPMTAKNNRSNVVMEERRNPPLSNFNRKRG